MTSPIPLLKLGTRGSPLALAQAHWVKAELMRTHGLERADVAIEIFKTSGDKILDRPLSEVGGKGLFTKELEDALLAGRIDLAVHSMKDVATDVPEGLEIVAMLPREDHRDRLITVAGDIRRIEKLPHGARIGTSSLRRAAQLNFQRPDLEIVPFRGNVGTRLEKLRRGEADATILAAAGLNRLGQADLGAPMPIGQMLPAPAQGAVGIECMTESVHRSLLLALTEIETAEAVQMERQFLAALEGSCRTPIAALARWTANADLELRGEALLPDGSEKIAGSRSGDPSDAAHMARDLAAELRGRASPALRLLIG
jgi:hydroxymethylbilane synthase